MDRLDAMRVFAAAVDEGSLAGAARKLGRSPAAVLSEAGSRYATACRRMLTDLDEADMLVASERSAPRGLLTLTAPVAAGEDIQAPVVDAFMETYPRVSVRLLLLDRLVNLIDEGIDVALRISHPRCAPSSISQRRGLALDLPD